MVAHIEEKLREERSPEQVGDTMADTAGVRVSHERIYLHIREDKQNGGDLYKHPRIADGKKRRKRYGKKDRRGRIPGRVDISECPEIVAAKERVGDREADLVSGSHHHGFLVTVVERKSKFTIIGHVARKTAEAVSKEVIRLLKDVRSGCIPSPTTTGGSSRCTRMSMPHLSAPATSPRPATRGSGD